jgi:hypothetical protein
MGSAWSLKNGVQVEALDWFAKRLVRARALMPAADFDTVIGEDFAQTVTSQLTETSDTVQADPETTLVRGGVVTVAAGDSGAGGAGTLKLVGPPGEAAGAHVQGQNLGPWYIAGLTKIIRPADASGNTVDGIAVRNDDGSDFVAIGMRGPSSATNWVGAVFVSPGLTTVLGPLLDNDESPVWHLFEIWNDGTLIHFAIDEVNFTDTIDAATAGATFGQLASRVTSPGAGFPAFGLFDKWAAVVKSMTVGEP